MQLKQLAQLNMILGQMNFVVSNYVQFVNDVIRVLHKKCLIVLLPMM
nr:MAG TPA: hypothetical protein [Caudoviricetes sp.]